MKIVLIGAGNVAVHLGPILWKKGHKIVQLYSRSRKSGQSLARNLNCELTLNVEKIIQNADIYIIALRDEAITVFLKQIKFIPRLIVHTSGSTAFDVFPRGMKNTGVLYPLQTFSRSSKDNPHTIPFCIEGSNPESTRKIIALAKSISPNVFKLKSSERAYVHLAAVFANNFTNFLFTNAEKILTKKKIPFTMLRPLILETALKIQSGTPGKMQTGPAKRGDAEIINKHLKLLNDFPELKVIYSLLSKSIEKEYGLRL